MNPNVWALLEEPQQFDPSMLLMQQQAALSPQVQEVQVRERVKQRVPAQMPQTMPQQQMTQPQVDPMAQQYLESISGRQENLKGLRERLTQALGQQEGWQGTNLRPALAFADSLLGTNTAQSYQLPVTQRQREVAQLQTLADREGQALTDDQMNYMRLQEQMKANAGKMDAKDQWLDTWQKIKMAELGLGRDKMNDQAAKDPKVSGEAWKAAGFAKRLQQSEDVFNQLMSEGFQGPTRGDQALSFLPKEMQSGNYRKYDQATRNFINATLRRESGAAISPSEFANAEEQYLPKAGDPPDVLAQKAANRMQVFENFKAEGQSAYDKIPYVSPTGGKVESNEVVVSNGRETMSIPRSDLKDAIRDGFREVK
jgi:hypothetical protein